MTTSDLVDMRAQFMAKRVALDGVIAALTVLIGDAPIPAAEPAPKSRHPWSKKKATTKPATKQPRAAPKVAVTAPVRHTPTVAAAVKSTGIPATDAVRARDAAILRAIHAAGATGVAFMEIRAAVPKEDGLTDDQRRASISNALTRLRLKGQAKTIDGGRWVAL